MNFILYDGMFEWKNLFPITLTRSISEIHLGLFTIKERWEKKLGYKAICIFTQPFLLKKNSFKKNKILFKNVFIINSSFIPNEELINTIISLKKNEAISFQKNIVAARINIFSYEEYEYKNFFSIKKYSKVYEINKIIHIKNVWDIIVQNKNILKKDFMFYTKGKRSSTLLGRNILICKERIYLKENIVTNNVVLNAKFGPIYIDKGVEIMEGCLIRGPVYIGKKTIVNMGSKIYGNTTIGSFCKVGGEIKNSLLFSYSNKAHDGFLGHSILGKWCNLGAGTNVSNLRNDYRDVTLWNYEKKIFSPINMQFFGIIMGDHSKSAINTQFNTATVIGVCTSIFGYGFPPRYIPSFSFGGIQCNKRIPFYRVCETANLMMKRRKKKLSILEEKILEHLYKMSNV
ncbi:putative sugar nucleotidyl transferase [Blattabacterium cuenoti]|uniref:putative sugar nucleotidyl transferase n=1 Tax=Blattabacterium cuenoti TaxID=1653831 RepID=UPI00163BC372|nr:putative sugar nucleotidyl transferase [Blattabacterium cuenoti]